MAWGYSSNQFAGVNGYQPRTYSEKQDGYGGGYTGQGITPVSRGSGSGPLGTDNNWTWAYGSPSDQKRAAQNKAGGSYRGGSSGSTRTQRLRFTEDEPDLPTLPTLEMPKVDKRKIRALTQQIAAPSIRKLNESVQTAMNIHTDNPNVRRMTLREALQGYGSGLESAMAGAGGQARQEHQQELSLLAAEAQANWKASTEALMMQYQNAYKKYMASAENITETGGGGDGMVVRRNVWGTPYLAPDSNISRHTGANTSY